MQGPSPTKPFVDALNSPKLDSSDYILIAMRILSEKLGATINADIAKIQQDYIKSNYAEAMLKIKALCEKHKADIKDDKLITLLIDKRLTVLDNPMENQSRRYFETKYSKAVWESQEQPSFSALEKLSALMKEKLNEKENVQVKEQEKATQLQAGLPAKVTDIKLAAKVIGDMRAFGEIHSQISGVESQLRQPKESIAHTKDRGGKRIDDKKDKLLSMNPGIVKASSPMPVNERLDASASNRLPDMFDIDKPKGGYSSQRKDVPFVNSVSGTTFTLASVLKSYIAKYKEDPHLEADVNNLVKAFVSYTNSNGFHSLGEMLDVLKDPAVQQVFKDANIKLNEDFLSAPKLKTVMDRSADYGKQIRLQQWVNASIPQTGQGPILLAQARSKTLIQSKPPQTIPFILISNGVKEDAPTVMDVTSAVEKIKDSRGPMVAKTALDDFIKYAEQKLPKMDITDLKKLKVDAPMVPPKPPDVQKPSKHL